MSRVVITDIEAPEEATSARVNSTVTSWNAALAAGALGAANFRQEGIDRRSLSAAGHAVFEVATPPVYSHLASLSVTSAVYAVVPLNAGATPMMTADITPSSGSDVMVRASTVFVGDSTSAVNDTLVDLVIERSTDAGATWATMATCSRHRFQIGSPSVVHLNAPVMLMGHQTGAGTPVRFRLSYKAAPGTIVFENGVIFAEVYAR